MKQRQIIFNGEMVQAILSGNKTQTRRIIKVPTAHNFNFFVYDGPVSGKRKALFSDGEFPDSPNEIYINEPVKVGDQLYVRETWNRTNPNGDNGVYYYRADGKHPDCIGGRSYVGDEVWRPSIHMPKSVSRITLEITDVRVERLQDISEEDARAEGFCSDGWTPSYSDPDNSSMAESISASENFAEYWNSIYNNWNDNPWVWVISFKLSDV